MKKVITIILTIIAMIEISASVLYVHVFSSKAKINVKKDIVVNKPKDENKEEKKDDSYKTVVKEMEEKAKTDIENETEITEKRINDIITYIETYYTKPIDKTNQPIYQQLVYYGYYLKYLVTYEEGETVSEIYKLAENTIIYGNEALKFIENAEKGLDKVEQPATPEPTTSVEPIETENTETEATPTPIATGEIAEPTTTPTNIIVVSTSTAVENAKSKVKTSITIINNLTRKNLVTDYKARSGK